MATKAQPVGWVDTQKKAASAAAPAQPTIEDRLAVLEANAGGGLTAEELTGLRALLDRAGFDREKGSF